MKLRTVQVVLRHGDRTPLHNMFLSKAQESIVSSSQKIKDELNQWAKVLPNNEVLQILDDHFRIKNENSAHLNPSETTFGHLTDRGIQQLLDKGKHARCNLIREGFDIDSLNYQDIRVISSNYARTQKSVQAFLKTLLHSSNANENPIIEVPDTRVDIINAYNAFPNLIEMRTALVESKDEFLNEENRLEDIKQELMNYLPHLTENNFSWMAAADYYMCRKAHEIPLVPGTENFEAEVLHHLSFRFLQYYSDKKILRLVSGGIMNSIMKQLNRATESGHGPRLSVYSGHDVTLVAILHALNLQHKFESTYWPTYATSIWFKLYETDEGKWSVQIHLESGNQDQQSLLSENLESFKSRLSNVIYIGKL